MVDERIILGIDPGTNVMGYGIIEVKNNKPTLLSIGALSLESCENHAIKLKKIFETTLQLIEEYHPDEVAAEAPFYGKNVQSMLKLGRAQGVALAAALYRNLPIFEYSPRKIKQAITGNGNASKEQVAAMMVHLQLIKAIPENLDATDGLAAALCHFFQNKVAAQSKSFSSWKAFIKQNPDKVK